MYQVVIENFGNDAHGRESTTIAESNSLAPCVYKIESLFRSASELGLSPELRFHFDTGQKNGFYYTIGNNEKFKVSIQEVTVDLLAWRHPSAIP